MISVYHAKYYAHELTRRHAADGVDRLSQSLFDASVDLNPHQIEAALFALRNPLQEGVLLADEVGLGKTIEAALVVCQYWAERRRRLLVICPASLRKQWAQELQEKFAVPTSVVDAVSLRKKSAGDILATLQGLVGKTVIIMSYQFATKLEAELRAVPWDVVVIDEAHKLRNAHRASNRTGQALKRALAGRKKLLSIRSTSPQVMPRTSPDRAAVRIVNFNARAPMPGCPDKSFMKAPTSFQGRAAKCWTRATLLLAGSRVSR